jgi:hypothetical protein
MSIRNLKAGLATYFVSPLAAIVIEYAQLSRREAVRVLADQYLPMSSNRVGAIRPAYDHNWVRLEVSYAYLVNIPIEDLIYLEQGQKPTSITLKMAFNQIGEEGYRSLADIVKKNINAVIYGDD